MSYLPRNSKLIFKTGNGIMQTGNGIISSTSRPPIKKILLQHFLHIHQGVQIDFQNRIWNYPNRKWHYFSHFKASDQKTSFTTFSLYLPRNSKLIFNTGNGIIQTGNGFISPTFRPLIKKLLLQNISHLYRSIKLESD